jgi:hypothetical protein
MVILEDVDFQPFADERDTQPDRIWSRSFHDKVEARSFQQAYGLKYADAISKLPQTVASQLGHD